MPRPEPTEIRIDEHGDESHESWLLVRANLVSGWTRLFDSEIKHQHYVSVIVTRCTRKRDLNRDWLHQTKTLIEFNMSQAQWGAFVSSFGNGGGVPATLDFLVGEGAVPQPVHVNSRLDLSHKEVYASHKEALAKVKVAQQRVQEAFDQKLGVKETRSRLNVLQRHIDQLPGNVEFAAKSLTEHVENVVTKARADIEGMVLNASVDRQIEGRNVLALPFD